MKRRLLAGSAVPPHLVPMGQWPKVTRGVIDGMPCESTDLGVVYLPPSLYAAAERAGFEMAHYHPTPLILVR